MKNFSLTGLKPSNFWASDSGARVTAFIIWVSPRVNIAEPCTLGKYLTSEVSSLISSKFLPSGLISSFKSASLISFFSM